MMLREMERHRILLRSGPRIDLGSNGKCLSVAFIVAQGEKSNDDDDDDDVRMQQESIG